MWNRNRWLWRSAALGAAMASALAIHSCGSSSKSTAPGGGGGGGLELNSGDILSGTSFAHVFATPGSFSYHCIYHGGMTGTVVVNSGGSTMDTTFTMVTGGSNPTITAKVGATVHWSNSTGTKHTVTSN
jgi:plastocyanin